jgi:hypothetical protein
MHVLEWIAEQRIEEAVSRGEFAGLPGEGAPLPPEDNEHVPDDMRLAWRVLKNAGLLD